MSATYTVQAGDTLSRVAREHDLPSWRTLWNHPENTSLRERRQDPNVLMPGDEVFIPDPEPLEFELRLNQYNRFVVYPNRPLLRVRLIDPNAEPLPLTPYELTVANEVIEGVTDEDGVLRAALPNDDVQDLELVAYPDRAGTADEGDTGESAANAEGGSEQEGEAPPEEVLRWTFKLAELVHADHDDGVEHRLQNLGYVAEQGSEQGDQQGAEQDATGDSEAGQERSDDNEQVPDPLELALQCFQDDHGVDEEGPGSATRARLAESHRC